MGNPDVAAVTPAATQAARLMQLEPDALDAEQNRDNRNQKAYRGKQCN
jgi:hypothetical protein